jgi:hypothetical protein
MPAWFVSGEEFAWDRHTLLVGAGVHHGRSLPEPAPQLHPQVPVWLQVRHRLRDRRQKQPGAHGGLQRVQPMHGPGQRQLPGAYQRRPRAGLHPQVHKRAIRTRRLLQSRSHPLLIFVPILTRLHSGD